MPPADRWVHPATEVRASTIAGRGLFATGDIAEGAPVLRVDDDLARGTNHSCDPTLGWADASTLVALRDLHAGDELTDDYATSTSDPSFVLYCHCETYRCRQVVEGTDWQIPQLQLRYAGHWIPHVQKLIDAAQ